VACWAITHVSYLAKYMCRDFDSRPEHVHVATSHDQRMVCPWVHCIHKDVYIEKLTRP
jgi:hypothetical protein